MPFFFFDSSGSAPRPAPTPSLPPSTPLPPLPLPPQSPACSSLSHPLAQTDARLSRTHGRGGVDRVRWSAAGTHVMASSRAGLLAIYETRSWSLSLHRSVHLPTQVRAFANANAARAHPAQSAHALSACACTHRCSTHAPSHALRCRFPRPSFSPQPSLARRLLFRTLCPPLPELARKAPSW